MWREEKHGSDDITHVIVTRGKLHDHLGIFLDYSKKKAVDMTEHVDQMKEEVPEKLEIEIKVWSDKFFLCLI